MEDALNHSLFTRGGGGNYSRNVSLSPLSGVESSGVCCSACEKSGRDM